MSKVTFWNTLAVEDLARARAFYSALGFAVGDVPGGAGITVRPGEGGLLCLFPKATFRQMIPGEVCDATRAQEIIQSVSADTRVGVDELFAKAKAAGARVIGEPNEAPWGYSGAFADPDGHVWSVLWMPG